MKNTTLCYIRQNGKYLMLHRTKKQNDMSKDKWIGIGGKFEDKESPEDCILRETFEETGLTLTDYKYRGIVTFIADIYETEYMHLFTADNFSGKMKEVCTEGDLQWIDADKLYDLNLWEGDIVFMKLLEQGIPFFSLKIQYEGDNFVCAILNGQRIK